LDSYTKIRYDKKFDTLYITFESNEDSYGVHLTDNIIIMKDIDEPSIVTGITILGFKRLCDFNDESLNILSQYSVDLNKLKSYIK